METVTLLSTLPPPINSKGKKTKTKRGKKELSGKGIRIEEGNIILTFT